MSILKNIHLTVCIYYMSYLHATYVILYCRLTYVRSVRSETERGINCVTISPTMGDISFCSEYSKLMFYLERMAFLTTIRNESNSSQPYCVV